MIVLSGMGPGPAVKACRLLIERHRVHSVVNAGICGAVLDGIKVGTIFRVSETRFEPGSDQESPAELYRCPGGPWSDLAEERLTTCIVPVFEAERRQAIAAWGGIVDMEGAAIARICRKHSLPCYLIKAVSDLADEHGKESVQRHIDSLSERVGEIVLAGLAALEDSR